MIKKFINWAKRHKIITGVIILIIIIAAVSTGSKNDKQATIASNASTTSLPTANKPAVPITTTNQPSKSAAETFCDNNAILKVDTKEISVVSLSFPQDYYTDSGSEDANSNEIWVLQWDGKNKTTEDKVEFCLPS
ncbi:MAG: hypothetical protein WDN66_05795 [Candidatus Saccharibacteria bacterium]